MAPFAVVYHSGYGHTQRLAQAVADGAQGQLLAINADGELSAGDWQVLAQAPAIVLGAPTYMGGPSWQFKRFADASSRPWYSQAWKDKLFAGFTNSAATNGDKQITLDYLYHLAMQHGGLWVGLGVMPANAKAATRNDPNWLGAYSGAMAQSPADASAAEMFAGDLETGRQLGLRVAHTVARLGGAAGA